MSLSDRDYMRVESEDAIRAAAGSQGRTSGRRASSNPLSKSEQVGLVIAAVAIITLFAFAIF